MRFWIFAFFTLLTSHFSLSAQSPFPDSSPVRISFRETIRDLPINDPSSDENEQIWMVGTRRTIRIEGSAPLTGFDTTTLTDLSPFSISVGDFSTSTMPELEGRLGDGETFKPGASGSINIPITGLNMDTGEEEDVGSISLTWTPGTVEFVVSINNVNKESTPIDYGIGGDFYRETNTTIDGEDLTASFTFGPFTCDLRTVYTTGTASVGFDSLDRVPDQLSNIVMEGAIDYLAPTINIVSPAANAKTSIGQYTIAGTVQDKREIKRLEGPTLIFPGEVSTVEVQISTTVIEGEFVPAELLNGTNWRLANAELYPGENFVTVRATDVHGNVTTTSQRKLTFLQRGPLSVEAIASNFPDGNGNPAGKVAGSFFTGKEKFITPIIGGPKVTNNNSNEEAGQFFTVKATPAPGAVFNGWKATIKGVDYFTSANETLVFETKPNLVLSAEFVPNPFAPVLGTYHGLISGDDAKERGLFKIAISKTGAFTGKAQFGAVTLPLKGKVLGSGRWFQTITKSGKTYTINWIVNVSQAGNRYLTGTITSAGFAAEIAADLKDWRKAKGLDPGKLATSFAGNYTIFLTPPSAPESKAPKGIGYGRVTISALGAVTFKGQLGDGTKVSSSSILAQPESGPVVFPLFIALEKKIGNISGYVTHEVKPGSDLTAELVWDEPATTKAEPQAFEETVTLSGALYTKPATIADRAMLQASSGAGAIFLNLPEYDVPANPVGLPYSISESATLDARTHALTIGNTQNLNLRMKISATTGLFTGSFKDPNLKKTISFAGAVNQKADGGNGVAKGVFVRGNRAGAVTFGLP